MRLNLETKIKATISQVVDYYASALVIKGCKVERKQDSFSYFMPYVIFPIGSDFENFISKGDISFVLDEKSLKLNYYLKAGKPFEIAFLIFSLACFYSLGFMAILAFLSFIMIYQYLLFRNFVRRTFNDLKTHYK